MTAAMGMAWDPTSRRVHERVEKKVRLTDAPDIFGSRGPCRPEVILFEFLRLDGGPWNSKITIYATRTGRLIRDCFSPGEVRSPQQWLTDLIDQTTPEETP